MFYSASLSVCFKKFTVENTYAINCYSRSSCLQMFFKIGLHKNIARFTGKHLCSSLFLIKLQIYSMKLSQTRDSGTDTFRWISQNFSLLVFYRTLPDDWFCIITHAVCCPITTASVTRWCCALNLSIASLKLTLSRA